MTANSRGHDRPDTALARAYAATHYHVALPHQTLILRIGQHEARFEAYLRERGIPQASLLTAWNPRSRIVPERENHELQTRLVRELEHGGWACWPTVHRDPAGRWPDEPGYCVAGMGAAELDSWLRDFDQNAAVLIQPPAAPRLVWHPEERDGTTSP